MNKLKVGDEVLDTIAEIELHRQGMVGEHDPASARSEALRRLHELLEHERASLQQNAESQTHHANVAAVTHEIERVKQLAGSGGSTTMQTRKPSQPAPAARPNPPHNPARNNGRRFLGRRGDR